MTLKPLQANSDVSDIRASRQRACSLALIGAVMTFSILPLRGPVARAQTPATEGSRRRPSDAAERLVDQSIHRGLGWLTQAIRRNGTVAPDEYGEADLACTAITGLALMAEGSTPRSGRYAQDCERVLYAVLDLSRRRLESGNSISLVQRKIGRNADLFFAALFLSQAYGEMPFDRDLIRDTLKQLVNRICESQGADGTWGDEAWAPVLGTVMGWESLRSAHTAGLRIDASADLVAKALQRTLIESYRPPRDNSWMHEFYKETASLRVLYSSRYRDNELIDRTVERLLKLARTERATFDSAGGEEYLAFYLVSECLLKERRANWSEWNPLVTDNLIRIQNSDGSWTGHHCITSRTFCTAAALLTLLAPRLNLPISDF